jgi:hypothetical protein
MNTRPPIVLSALMLLSACESPTDPKAAESEQQIAQLSEAVATLNAKVEVLENEASAQDFLDGIETIAFLTPGDDGYSVIAMDLGKLTVSLADVKAYANGSRVSLQFGNLSSAYIEGAKAKVEWGRMNEDGIPDNATAKTREVKFSKVLAPGRWTKVDVVLEGVPPSELGWLRIRELTHSGIRLF